MVPEFLSKIPDEILEKIPFRNIKTYVTLVKIDSRIEKICPWGRLCEDYWLELLLEKPEFICYWTGRKLSPYCWVKLIEKYPILPVSNNSIQLVPNCHSHCFQYRDLSFFSQFAPMVKSNPGMIRVLCLTVNAA